MTRTLCVDANYLLKQSCHGNKHTYDEDYGYIGGITTFYMIIRKMIKAHNINKVILFWDGINSGRLRFEMYPLYKHDRNKDWYNNELILSDGDINKLNHYNDEEKSILKQRLRIKSYAEEFFIRQFEDAQVESDDNIAYYVQHLKEPDEYCLIYTNDADFFVLIDDNIEVYKTSVGAVLNKHNFHILYNRFHHTNAALIKAIEGCDSDKVYGVMGVKEKTLLNHFPELSKPNCSFEFIYQKAKEINAGRKKPLKALQNIINGTTSRPEDFPQILTGEHLFELNYKLVNLKEPLTTEESREELEIQTLSPISSEGRGGKNILRLMHEDGFIKVIYKGADGVGDFLKEFLPVVNAEKAYYKKYLEENPD